MSIVEQEKKNKTRENILRLYEEGILTKVERDSWLISFGCYTAKEFSESILERKRKEKPDMYPTPKQYDPEAPVKVYTRKSQKNKK